MLGTTDLRLTKEISKFEINYLLPSDIEKTNCTQTKFGAIYSLVTDLRIHNIKY